MPWPTPQDYNEAIQNPAIAFKDPELRPAQPELTALGLPRPITGNFASVYRMHCSGRDLAVRCFWREYADMRERYRAISDHLATVHLPYTVAFEYLPDGVRIRGHWYPLLKMEWLDGWLLSEWVEARLGDRMALSQLAQEWVAMVAALERAGVAHGDLQHGNVLLVGDELKLVDYDGMYVPALRGRDSHELGHPHYQHPRRTGSDFGAYTDRFSAWVIYLSLLALSESPELWVQLGGGDECLLLRRQDFLQPEGSTVLAVLQRHPDRRARELASRFQHALDDGPDRVPSLAQALLVPVGRRRRQGARSPSATWCSVVGHPLPASIRSHESRLAHGHAGGGPGVSQEPWLVSAPSKVQFASISGIHRAHSGAGSAAHQASFIGSGNDRSPRRALDSLSHRSGGARSSRLAQ